MGKPRGRESVHRVELQLERVLRVRISLEEEYTCERTGTGSCQIMKTLLPFQPNKGIWPKENETFPGMPVSERET